MTRTILTLAVLLSVGCAAKPERPTSEVTKARELLIVVSPYLNDLASVLTDITRWMIRLEDTPHIRMIDGADGLQIAEMTVPSVNYFKEEAMIQSLREPIQALNAWHRKVPTNTNWHGTGALDIPTVLKRVIQGRVEPPQILVFIGSPVFRSNQAEFDFSVPHYRYPSVGHLQDPRSPFACIGGAENSLKDCAVHFLFPMEKTTAWPATYESKLHHFYAGLVYARGGTLASFTPDLSHGLKAASNNQFGSVMTPVVSTDPDGVTGTSMIDCEHPSTSPRPLSHLADATTTSETPSVTPTLATDGPTASPENSKIPTKLNEPAQQTAAVGKEDESSKEETTEQAPVSRPETPAPSSKAGWVTITLRYQNDSADVDLYAKAHQAAAEVSYRNPRTPLHGVFVTGFDVETNEHIETIRFLDGLDLTKAEVWLNHAGGPGPVKGRVIFETEQGRMEKPFEFLAEKGGHSNYRRTSTRKESTRWLGINLIRWSTTAVGAHEK